MTTELLTKDIIVYVFSYLDPPELLRAGYVCKKWRQLSQDDLIWKRHCKVKETSYYFHNDSRKEGGIEFPQLSLPDACQSWMNVYIKYAKRVLPNWRWSSIEKDGAILLYKEDLQAKRYSGGHNPSVKSNKSCSGVASYYFEVQIDSVGDWISFGFSTSQYNVSSGQHIGKGLGSCGYYSDCGTHSIFACTSYEGKITEKNVKSINAGDKIGCLLNMYIGSATFYVNGREEAVFVDTAWSNDRLRSPHKNTSGDVQEIQLLPSLSIGSRATVSVVTNPSIPNNLLQNDPLLFD